jgi:hypothetical protein
LELAVALDAGFEQGRRRLQRCFRRPRCSGGPAWCHGAVSRRRIAARRWMARVDWMRKFFEKGSGGGNVL